MSTPAATPSYVEVDYYDGNAIYGSSGGCIFSGDSIIIPSADGALAYAMYSFNTGGYDPEKLEVGLSVSANGTAWIGVSDFVAGAWQFHGPYTSPASIDLNGYGYLSDTGQFYVVIVSFNGAAVTCDHLVLTYDNAITSAYSVSGTVLDEHGAPIGGVNITADPGSTVAVTDAQGEYYLHVESAGDYTLNPSSLDDYSLSPPSRCQRLARDGRDLPTRTDVTGQCDAEGAGGLLLPPAGGRRLQRRDGSLCSAMWPLRYTAEPQRRGTPRAHRAQYRRRQEDYTGCDFVATGGAPTYAIRGRIALADDTPVSDVVVVLNPTYRIAFTDAGGDYAFFGVGNGSYTVEPHLGFYTFNPETRNVVVADASVVDQDFTATEPPPTYAVSGVITNQDYGLGIPNVRVQIKHQGPSEPVIATAYSDASGYYLLSVPDGDYELLFTKAYYHLLPLLVTVNGANKTVDKSGFLTDGVSWDSFVHEYVSTIASSATGRTGMAVNPFAHVLEVKAAAKPHFSRGA
jgi:hypothetical protein